MISRAIHPGRALLLALALALAGCAPSSDRDTARSGAPLDPASPPPKKIWVGDFIVPDELLKGSRATGTELAELKVGLSVLCGQLAAAHLDRAVTPAERYYGGQDVSPDDWLMVGRVRRFECEGTPGGGKTRLLCRVRAFSIQSGEEGPTLEFDAPHDDRPAPSIGAAIEQMARSVSLAMERQFVMRGWPLAGRAPTGTPARAARTPGLEFRD